MRLRSLRLLAGLTLLCFASGCPKPAAIKARQDKLRVEIAQAGQLGGKDCAPREFARAESQLIFSDIELAQGDYLRASEHITEGFRMARAAQRGAKNCDKKIVVMTTTTPTPTPLVIVTTPTPTPKKTPTPVVIKDTDEDGLTDDKDRCPEDPGPKATKGCPDRDGDFIADLDDRCPDEPGAPQNDGCPKTVVVMITPTPTETPTPPPPTPEPTVDMMKIDTDGDGVPDIKDKCPAEVGPLSNQGCPYTDTDGDGITDDRDKCPTTVGVPQYDGCPPPDRDKDGIADGSDKCPDVAAPGTPDGCPQFKYIVINPKSKQIELKQKIHFATGKARILPDSFVILDEVVKALGGNGKMHVRIEGHTDWVGKATYNLRLSKRRADAVLAYLAGKGIAMTRIRAVGLGETTPIASNTTPEGRALNRRVEFHITKQ